MKTLNVFLIVICLSDATTFAQGLGEAKILAQNLSDSNINRFALSRKWLGHFFFESKNDGYESRVESSAYFLTPNGRHDPKAELYAAIGDLQKPDEMTSEHFCRYVSRYEMVLHEFPELRKPNYHCTKFESWKDHLAVSEIRLAFATGYIKNPASGFGHLFIKLVSSTSTSELLNYGVSFSAQTGLDTGAEYALKGLLGLYSGGFVFLPYYRLIKDYSDIEGRDIWEFNLQLSDSERMDLLAFIYEFDAQTVNYTFLNNNCAGVLERLLFSIKNTGSSEAFNYKPWTIPLESFQRIAAVTEPKEFRVQYSLKSVRSQWQDQLSPIEKQSIVDSKRTLELPRLSVKALDFILLDGKIQATDLDTAEYTQILQYRSKLDGDTFSTVNAGVGGKSQLLERPKSSMIAIGTEWNGSQNEIGLRLNLLNDRLIYNQGFSEINVLDFQFKTDQKKSLTFSNLKLFSFLAGEPIDFLRQPLSFGAGIGYAESKGVTSEASAGLLFSRSSWLFFPKFKLQTWERYAELGPDFDVYYFLPRLHLKVSASSMSMEVEAQTMWNGTYTISMSTKNTFDSKSTTNQIAVGRFF